MSPNHADSRLDIADEKDTVLDIKKSDVSSSEEHFGDTETYQLSDKKEAEIHSFEGDPDLRDNIVDDDDEVDGEVPTQEEMDTLRHVAGHIPFRCWLIALVELAERFSYYGLSAPFQNYMSNGPDDTPAGLLQLDSSGATGLSYFFQFWCYVTPIFGGYMADTHWGKYNTIAVGTGIYLVGIFILFITSIPSITDKNTGLGGFIVAIILIGIATGMIKANLSVLIADQLPKRKPHVKTLKSGERVIEDPNITMQNVFMWFYLMINIGSLSVIATTELEAHKGFWAAYLLPFCFFWIAVVVLVFGRKKYIRPPIGEKVISRCFKVLWVLMKNKFNFDEALPSVHPERDYPWNDKFVSEIKTALAACKVFLFYPIYWVCYGQMISTFVTQGSMLELHGLPNDFFQAIDSIALIVFIPIFESVLYPFIRRYTPLKPITKIFWGFTFGSLAMTWACVLQHFVYKAGPYYQFPLEGGGPNKVHVAWQVPAYVLIAFSEIFASITGLEYAYSKAPDSMKSFIMSIFLVTNAFGSAIGCALSPVSKDPDYTWLFGGLAVSCFIAGCLFWITFRSYNDTIDAAKIESDDEEIERNNAEIEMLQPIDSRHDSHDSI